VESEEPLIVEEFESNKQIVQDENIAIIDNP
jgi:hypothetical protein